MVEKLESDEETHRNLSSSISCYRVRAGVNTHTHIRVYISSHKTVILRAVEVICPPTGAAVTSVDLYESTAVQT